MSNEFGPGHYDTTGEVAVRPTPIITGKAGDRWFAPCDANGDGGTQINAMWLNLLIAEMRGAYRSAGAEHGENNEEKLAEAMARYASGGIFCVSTGASNAYVLTQSGNFVPPKSLFPGMTLLWKPSFQNNDVATANAFALGIKPILRESGDPLEEGDLTGRYVITVYDPAANGGSGAHILMEFTRGSAGGGSASGGLLNVQAFQVTGTYTKTLGAKRALVFVTAPGGGGGGNNDGSGRGGGGGAGETRIGFLDLTSVATIAVTIGSSGSPGNGADGGDAGDTVFSTLTAKGGKGGGRTGTFGGGATNGAGAPGGKNGSGGLLSLPGGAGASGGPVDGGVGGASFWGGGGRPGAHNTFGAAGGNGEAPGSGGGGGDNGDPGGGGAPGLVFILEFA